MRLVTILALSGATFLLAGCQPGLQEGHFTCTSDDTCPSGWFCRSDNRCYSTREGGPDTGIVVDSGMDSSTDAMMDASEDVPVVCEPALNELSLLFVVDSSGSMAEEQQVLSFSLLAMLDTLASVDHDGDGAPGLDNIHVGVVTTDMGDGGFGSPTCSDLGDDGILRNFGNPDLGCPPEFPSFLAYGADIELDLAAMEIGCVAQVGTVGCGHEQPFEAALKALSTADTGITFWDGSTGHGDGANEGFLTPEGMLAIVFLSDENDCSVEDLDLLNPMSDIYDGSLNRRCWDFPEALYPLDRYEIGLTTNREPSRLATLSIVGIPPGAEGLSHGEILDLDEMQVRDDPVTGFLEPSCESGMGFALPPIRFVELASILEGRGSLTRVSSICNDTYEEPLASFMFEVMDRMAGTCGS